MTSRSSNTPATPVSNPASAQGVDEFCTCGNPQVVCDQFACVCKVCGRDAASQRPTSPASARGVEPCPFCGSAGMMIPCMEDWAETGYQPMGRLIVCAANDCAGAGMPVYGEDMEDRAIELWNRRASPAPSRDAAVPTSGGVGEAVAIERQACAYLQFEAPPWVSNDYSKGFWEGIAAYRRAINFRSTALSSAPATPSPAEAEAKEGRVVEGYSAAGDLSPGVPNSSDHTRRGFRP